MTGYPRLVTPSLEFKEQFLAFVRDYVADGGEKWGFQVALDNFPKYVTRAREYVDGIDLPPGFVPASTFWLMEQDGSIVGWVNVRHRLTERLMHRGGHVGYYIRPSERCKGYGTLICKLALEKAREIGLKRVLITCSSDNTASNRIIEKNGGILENEVWDQEDMEMVCRYWIDL